MLLYKRKLEFKVTYFVMIYIYIYVHFFSYIHICLLCSLQKKIFLNNLFTSDLSICHAAMNIVILL